MEILNAHDAEHFATRWLLESTPERAAWHIRHAADSADRCAGLTPHHSPTMRAGYETAARVLRSYLPDAKQLARKYAQGKP